MSMNDNLEEKIIGLESRLAFAEDTIAGLNAIVADQNKEIQSIGIYCRELKNKIDELSESGGSAGLGAEERPPHY
ncbi:MAG: SlyX family protein [Spirochaetales bacterium]|nr:SlyX family protein [Spirochaetales bacterium]